MTERAVCHAVWLGSVEYGEAWDLQRRLAGQRARGEIEDTLLLLEHPPVYTTGRRATCEERLLVPPDSLGAPLVTVDRGGDITFHGPGQLIAYPIITIGGRPRGVVDYVRGLEEAIIRTLAGYRIEGERVDGLTGVWVGGEKIAAIGVRVSRPGGGAWVTSHGLALNVNVDLDWFARIVPCGIAGHGVTSIERLTGGYVPLTEAAERLAGEFGAVFGREMTEIAAGLPV